MRSEEFFKNEVSKFVQKEWLVSINFNILFTFIYKRLLIHIYLYVLIFISLNEIKFYGDGNVVGYFC